jgi:hypothetical protein
MATRKVFIDETKNEISFHLGDDKRLNLKIEYAECCDIDHNIVLSETDTETFIMDLYRLKKQIPK